ncbi:MAG TPA: FGGY family carbohydrate kinase [Elusimicrobiales bacterium]|nr:FGGY family carbohydrate kinase [Elusimicrobiales bacterium]
MAEKFIIVLDQGSSSSRALAFDLDGNIRYKAQRRLEAAYPAPGLAEYDAEKLFSTQADSLAEVLAKLPAGSEPAALAIAAQRSTVVLWDRTTGVPLAPALSWQDGRAQELLGKIPLSNTKIHDLTGLYKTPYYSASKISWALESYPEVKAAAAERRLLAAPVASYIIWRLSGGRTFVIDPSQAQRTLLFNLRRLKWEPKLLAAFGLGAGLLPEVRPSVGCMGFVEAAGRRIPVTAMLGDQQAAMLGLGLETPGAGALNYGTGAFLLVNTGSVPVKIRGLLNSIGWQSGPSKKEICYFTESTVNSAGTALEWLKVKFGLFSDIGEVDVMCRASANRVFCLPAIGGIGAPYWDFSAFTAFTGFSPHTDKYDVVRGVTEGIAYMVGDAFDLVKKKGFRIEELKVSGGLSKIDWLLQFQADITGARIAALEETEATAMGAGLAAARGLGLAPAWRSSVSSRVFTPGIGEEERQNLLRGWRLFVKSTRRSSRDLRKLGVLPHN